MNKGSKTKIKTLSNENKSFLYNDLHYNDFCLTESDFYPPSDNRVWISNVKDIRGGDNFADYCNELFKMLDENSFFDN